MHGGSERRLGLARSIIGAENPPLDPRRARHYRLFFGLAAAVSGGFAIWAVLFPSAVLDLFQVDRPGYSMLLRGLGIVDGLLAFGYAYAALNLLRAKPFIAIGLAFRVIAPLVWVLAVAGGQLTARTLTLVIFLDVVWWIPFALFLLEGTGAGERLRALAPYACASLNLIAAGALLLLLRPGTEVVHDPASRILYITNHEFLWRAGWVCWIAAALSLLAFYAWWGARLPAWGWGVAALSIASVGLVLDLTAESLLIAWLPKDYATVAPMASLLTGGPGNGLYTVAGAVLTVGTRGLKGWFATWTWAIWAAGFGLSAFTFAGNFLGVAICSGLLFALFCPWAAVMGRKLA
jgi:small multidrug resistance pump